MQSRRSTPAAVTREAAGRMRGWSRVLAAAACAALTGCAPARIALPAGAGTPAPDAASAYEEAVRECRGVKTMQVTLSLSGRAGRTGLRGDVDAGFEAPDKVRLEGRHPIGRPVFILVATGADATLVLPRDDRVLRNAAADEIVNALVGLPLGAAELRALAAGCGFGAADPTGGRSYPDGWLAVDTGEATTYLRQVDGRWRVAAAVRPPVTVHYAAFTLARPSALRLQTAGPAAADVTARLSDVNINVPLEPEVFAVEVPASAVPLTLEELRRAGPLGTE